MSDSKEWVTIKIPKAIRAEAKAHEDTYGEIMQAGLGKDVGNPEVNEIIDAIQNEISMANDPGVELETEAIINELEELKNRVSENTIATNRLEKQLEELRQ